MDFRVRPATLHDAQSLAPRLRESDVIEVKRVSGMDPEDALVDSLRVSDWDMVWAAVLDDEAEAMFGANNINGVWGGIWMLGSDRIYENIPSFWKHCRHYLGVMHQRYEFLTNFVDVHHHSANRWMLKLGFEPFELVEINGHPFIQYISERPHV